MVASIPADNSNGTSAPVGVEVPLTCAGRAPQQRPARSGGQDGLDLQVKRDLVAHDDPAVLHGGAEVDVEVTPVDLTAGTEPGPGAAEGVRPEAVELEDQRHVLGDALERELAVEDVVAIRKPGPGRAVGHRRVGLDLEEVGGPDVLVALVLAGADRLQVDHRGRRGLERVVTGHDLAGEVRELAADLADHHVPDREADLGVHRVDGPGAGDVAGDRGLGGGGSHGGPPGAIWLNAQVLSRSTKFCQTLNYRRVCW